MKEDEVKNYAKFHRVSFEEWVNQLLEYAQNNGIPMIKSDLDLRAWKEYYDEGYSPGAALLEDLAYG